MVSVTVLTRIHAFSPSSECTSCYQQWHADSYSGGSFS